MNPLFQMLEEEMEVVVIVTSRIISDYPYFYNLNMRFMNEEESWELQKRKLVKAGKKIAEKCEGLPLLIPHTHLHSPQGSRMLEQRNQILFWRKPLIEYQRYS